MPLGIISDEEFQAELNNSSDVYETIKSVKSVKSEVVPLPHPGRINGDNNVPNSLRKIIGETSNIEGRSEALELADKFGVSPSSVSAYANGATSTKTYDETPNRKHINEAKEKISRKARNRLFLALNALTPDKLEDAKAVDLASVAKSMSGIVKEMEPEPEKESGGNKTVNFLIYSPQVREEKYYDSLTLRE
jgi:hypothetical protein